MDSDSFGSRISRFLTNLKLDISLPSDFKILDPYASPEVRRVVTEFCSRYYTGNAPRISAWGINPGRFGGGITGLSFTDPFALKNQLHIGTAIEGRRELSAEFISMVIEAVGGPREFYSKVFLSALCPLGFIRDGNNINFYDDAELHRKIVPFILDCMNEQIEVGIRKDICIVLGTGKLKKTMERDINPSIQFEKIIYLDHPRFVMQYKRKSVEEYVKRYAEAFAQ